MRVKARLFATLRDYVPEATIGRTFEVDLPEGARIRDLANHFKLPIELVKLAYVNGIYQELDYPLQDNDEVGMFPPIGGGCQND